MRSQPASVCPARASTPPSCAMTGKMWPGCTRSSGRASGAIAASTVRARSAAEMPVVTPSAASIDTVKLVPCDARLVATIGGRPSCRQRSSVSVRQTRPRAWRAMKLIASGVTKSAASTRSPSFSRSSSSTSTTMRPAFRSAMMSSVVLSVMRAWREAKRSFYPHAAGLGTRARLGSLCISMTIALHGPKRMDARRATQVVARPTNQGDRRRRRRFGLQPEGTRAVRAVCSVWSLSASLAKGVDHSLRLASFGNRGIPSRTATRRDRHTYAEAP